MVHFTLFFSPSSTHLALLASKFRPRIEFLHHVHIQKEITEYLKMLVLQHWCTLKQIVKKGWHRKILCILMIRIDKLSNNFDSYESFQSLKLQTWKIRAAIGTHNWNCFLLLWKYHPKIYNFWKTLTQWLCLLSCASISLRCD